MPSVTAVDPANRIALLDAIAVLAREAGKIILPYYRSDTAVIDKMDGSPVTAADRAADAHIVPVLKALTPGIPVVAEESVEAGDIPDVSGGRFWLVDPLDGTKEFINKSTDFTVNIGLIWDGVPVLGALHTPVDGMVWGGILGEGAWEESADGTRTPISVRKPGPDGLTIVASRSHRNPELEAYIETMDVKESVSRGSALKFCLVARGDADLYPRTGPTMEWDTAAGHAVLLAAGGSMTKFDGTPFDYGKPDFRNGHFIARGG
ncbi:3'(2'),5'-bisphosphate nucleotidase CysQ [Thalassobaculum sp. OXR-137]|uniref:3'(2'),5'-bisphosphate nucleotidase CysQ n=1 Tax=Thalassobaculum sp. OXR-137 TaxID=3100173 RepID=UPI002AC9D7C9|nr:3'(2'),5'-bisphosphate nucleotidase CysQ [Thalassobaculum sp. OXR-137]WPZ32452.1 3'(2'),5'-bisphosphate nucleotidase CysQ [Thalassobaculum sp. OXR-137]